MLSTDPHVVAAWRKFRTQVSQANATQRRELLTACACQTRRAIINTISGAGAGHVGGDLSVTDILTALFFATLHVNPEDPTMPDRDRFILSKGHCSVALYVTLARCGFFDDSTLSSFLAPDSPLSGHPCRTTVPGVEISTGALGHGLPAAVGCALASRIRVTPYRVYVVLGDGELQEGSNWEAFMCAAHQRLDNIVAIIDRNRLQQGDRTESTNALEPLSAKLSAFGWEVREVNGHDFDELLPTFSEPSDRPVAVIANTIKGRGVSFMEDSVAWHHRVPNVEQVAQALRELS